MIQTTGVTNVESVDIMHTTVLVIVVEAGVDVQGKIVERHKSFFSSTCSYDKVMLPV